MDISLLQKNIVVNGQFNVTLFDKYFFIKNAIITEDDFSKLKTPPLFNGFNTHIITDKFQVNINPVQIVINSITPEEDDKINEFAIKIIKASGINNFQSFGINFDWVLRFESQDDVRKKSKEYFYNDKTEFMSSFNTEDSHYGFYASKDVFGARLKLDIKPINNIFNPLKGEIKIDALYNQFNFHFILNSLDIIPFLEKFEEYKKETIKIMSTYK